MTNDDHGGTLRRATFGPEPAEGPAALVRSSIGALLLNQQPNGAFVASPDFSQYQYCWLRDASFVAYALDLVGEFAATERYHGWVARSVEGIAGAMDGAVARSRMGLWLHPEAMPPARFSLAGLPASDDWPNFQLDGYGVWLWSLHQHLLSSGSRHLAAPLVPAVERTARYLAALAFTPCFDAWEEDGGSVHTSTLACVYGGLDAASRMLDDAEMAARAEEVRAVVVEKGRREGRFEKSSGSREVDASLLWLTQPFAVVDRSSPSFVQTVDEVAEHLGFEGGIRRYPSDTYYGGGAWPLLSAFLGWHCATAGDRVTARRHLEWIVAHFDHEGHLGEQFGGERRDPVKYGEWVARWGPPAKELLWSHALFVVLAAAVARPDTDGANDHGMAKVFRQTPTK